MFILAGKCRKEHRVLIEFELQRNYMEQNLFKSKLHKSIDIIRLWMFALLCMVFNNTQLNENTIIYSFMNKLVLSKLKHTFPHNRFI